MFTYNPAEVALSVNGFPITGKGEDEFLAVEKNEDDSTMTIGADGEGAVSRNKNESGTFTITLLASSAANDVLMAAYGAFKAIGAVSIIFAKDLNGRSTHLGERCVPKKLPAVTYSRGVGERVWVWETDALVTNVGGSNLASTV